MFFTFYENFHLVSADFPPVRLIKFYFYRDLNFSDIQFLFSNNLLRSVECAHENYCISFSHYHRRYQYLIDDR